MQQVLFVNEPIPNYVTIAHCSASACLSAAFAAEAGASLDDLLHSSQSIILYVQQLHLTPMQVSSDIFINGY
jgi:hypothetical protein